MTRLRYLVPLVVILLVTIATVGPAAAQAIDAGRPEIRDDVSDIPPLPLEPAPGLPRPVDPTLTPTAGTDTFQLVGFTSVSLPPNRGILNYTLTCQREYPGSRMCSVAEVNATVAVPAPPGYGHAWVRAGSDPSLIPTWSGPEEPRPRDLADMPTDCNGWTTVSSIALGTAMDLGQSPECYGGFHVVTCDRSLVVACCAATAGAD